MPKHTFKPTYFNRPTWCDRCDKFIKGVVGKQGERCTLCGYSVHFKGLGLWIELNKSHEVMNSFSEYSKPSFQMQIIRRERRMPG